MFPDLEFIKTCLNGLRSRIEKVENWVVSFMRTNRPNWAQNDQDALDYIKNRPFYDQRVITTVTGTIAYATMQPASISNEIWKALLTKEATVRCVLGTYVYDYTSGDWIYYRNTSNAGKLEIMTSAPVALFTSISGLTLSGPPNVVITVPSGQLKQLDSKFLPAPTADTAGAIKADAAKTTDIQPVRLGADGKLYSSGIPIFTTSGDGSRYKANVPEITELVDGMLVVMIPHVTSTTTVPTLNINGIGSYSIYRFVSSSIGSPSPSMYANWLRSGGPVLLMYSSYRWFACNFPKPSTLDLDGYVPASHGGTGKGSLTKGSYLVGNNQSSVLLKTPTEVLDDIGAIPTPTTAEVGQVLVVKAVDANGKPTEWEAADMASGADGKSAYQYAQDGGYTGTEAEFATKLAEKMPTALPNPNALTFTGAVTGSYDGSEPLTVNIPSSAGGSGGSGGLPNWRLIKTLVFSSEIAEIVFSEDDNGEAFAVKEIMIVGTVPSMTSGGYFYCGIETGGVNAVWPTVGKEMRWWLASVNGALKTMLAVSNTAVTLTTDKNTSCPSDLVTIRVGASKGFTADGTLYVYGR